MIFSISIIGGFVLNFEEYMQRYIDEAELVRLPYEIIYKQLKYAHRLYLKDLPIIYDAKHLAKMLGCNVSLLYAISNSPYDFYKNHRIKKSNGGYRKINEPLLSLKKIQRWILKNILEKSPLHPSAKAFRKGYSLKHNARFHRNQEIVLSLDLKDFFTSIDFKKVLSIFMNLGYYKSVSVLLSKLCTYRDILPQGAPTSPAISNIVFNKVDQDFFKYSRDKNLRYTRYADDLTFSGDFKVGEVIGYVKYILKKNNFTLNETKINVMRKGMQQKVTGIVVNEKLQVPKKYRRNIRKEMYYINKYGVTNHLDKIDNCDMPDVYLSKLQGRIAFVLSIDANNEEFIEYSDIIKKLINQSNF